MEDFTFKDRELNSSEFKDKWGSLDILCETKIGDSYLIEFQGYSYKAMIERLLNYWAKKYSNLKSGEDYSELKKVISITIASVNILTDFPETDYHNVFKLYNSKYPDKILTDKEEIHIIEIPKWNKNIPNFDQMDDLDIILAYLSENITDEQRQNLSKRYKIMEQLLEEEGRFFADEKSLNAYRAAEKRKRDELSHINYVKDEARNEGINEGINKGISKGISKGRDNAFREIVIKMKKSNYDISEIKNLTGWSEQDINACQV